MVLFLFGLGRSRKQEKKKSQGQSSAWFHFSALCSELAAQLAAAESRCSLLEKQLDYMRKMIQHTENEKSQLLEKQVCSQGLSQGRIIKIMNCVMIFPTYCNFNIFKCGFVFQLAFVYFGVDNFPA